MPRVVGYRAVLGAAVLAASSALATGSQTGVAMPDLGFQWRNLEWPSGLRVVVEEDPSQPLVAIVAVVDVGSSQDPPGKEGLAHLVEHLTFRAKPDGKLQRSSLFELAAAGYWNANTGYDLTRFTTVGPREALPQLLALEGGRLSAPLAGLDGRAFELERGVVKSEISQRDEQGEVSAVQARLMGALYPEGHPYHRPLIGTVNSVSGLTLADAQGFVQQHYAPKNITLFITGDVDLDSMKETLAHSLPRELLDAPPSGPLALVPRLGDVAVQPPPARAGPHMETLRAPSEQRMLYIAWSLPGGSYGTLGHLEHFARSVFNNVALGAATTATDVAGMSTTLVEGRYGNTLICEVALKEGRDPEESLEHVLDQIVRMWQPGSDVVQEEIAFVRQQKLAYVGSAVRTESMVSRADGKGTLIHWTGDPLAWQKDAASIFDVSNAQLRSFAEKWLTRDRARAVFVEPSGEAEFLPDAEDTPTAFAAGEESGLPLAALTLGKYVHARVRSVRTFILKNGLEVVLARRPTAPTVGVVLGVPGGSATSEPLGVAELATLFARPTQVYNGPPARYGARLSFFTAADATYLSGRAAAGNLDNVLAILSDAAQSLHVDGGRLGSWNELVKSYRRVDALPSVRAERAFFEAVFPGSPLGRRARASDIERLGPGDVQTWVDRSFRPEGAVLAVVGDISLAGAERQVREAFGDWQGSLDARAESQFSKTSENKGPVPVVRVDRPGAKQTELRLGCSVPTKNENDVIALRLLGLRLKTRLWALSRDRLGDSYGFSGGAFLHRQASHLDVIGDVGSRGLSTVLAEARTELDGLSALTLTEEELALLKWRQGVASNTRYMTDLDLARGLVSARLAHLPVDFIPNFPELLARVTKEDVARVALACRKTAVLVLSGDPEALSKTFEARTEAGR